MVSVYGFGSYGRLGIGRINKTIFSWSVHLGGYRINDKEARAKKAKDYAKMIEVQTGIGQMLQAEAIKAIKAMDLSKASLPALLEMINSGVKIERSARAMDKKRRDHRKHIIKYFS